MKRFTARIVDIMKQENLYASQGGPIILSQIENEYGNVQSHYGPAAKTYVNWAATMATSLNTGVPWVMCQQSDTPDPLINTCNGFYCDSFTPNSAKKPKMWTENWTGWFLSFGDAVPYRPVEDLAFAVARFYQHGGTFQNYYTYHGGTNFGRTTGGPFIATSYDYDAPLDEYGLLRQPKWGHLKDLHKAIKLCEEALVATDPVTTSLGSNLEINSMSTVPRFVRNVFEDDIRSSKAFLSGWTSVNEPVGISSNSAFTKTGLLEQINTTADMSDYLWYSLSTDVKGDEPFLEDGSQTVLHAESLGHVLHAFVNGKLAGYGISLSTDVKGDEPFLEDGSQTVLHAESLGHFLHAFVNGKLAGSGIGSYSNPKVSMDVLITLIPGTNRFDLLSLTVGLQNYGAFFDKTGTGITGPVQLKGSKSGSTIDLSSQQWTYQVGLKGEGLGLYTGSSSLWMSHSTLPTKQPLIWYKTTFDAPTGDDPIALDMSGLGKGEAWVNGQSIGRYWPTYTAPKSGCTDSCNYRGSYSSSKCLENCGKPTQRFYHVPRSWLKPSGNILVLFEEIGGDPTQISFATKQVESLCSRVSESHPLPVDAWTSDQKTGTISGPTVLLECPHPSQVISSIKFASFGTPHGKCGSFSHGRCSSNKALPVVQKACIGSKSCSIVVSIDRFGDPCVGVTKSLAVEASCT